MKKFFLLMVVTGVMAVGARPGYAGDKDWARAGKALTVMEGLRVVSGGHLDVIGRVTGIDHGRHHSDHRGHQRVARHYTCREERHWVPSTRWEKRYVHEHESFDPEYGKIWVEGHYIRYQVQDGGYWQVKETCD